MDPLYQVTMPRFETEMGAFSKTPVTIASQLSLYRQIRYKGWANVVSALKIKFHTVTATS